MLDPASSAPRRPALQAPTPYSKPLTATASWSFFSFLGASHSERSPTAPGWVAFTVKTKPASAFLRNSKLLTLGRRRDCCAPSRCARSLLSQTLLYFTQPEAPCQRGPPNGTHARSPRATPTMPACQRGARREKGLRPRPPKAGPALGPAHLRPRLSRAPPTTTFWRQAPPEAPPARASNPVAVPLVSCPAAAVAFPGLRKKPGAAASSPHLGLLLRFSAIQGTKRYL